MSDLLFDPSSYRRARKLKIWEERYGLPYPRKKNKPAKTLKEVAKKFNCTLQAVQKHLISLQHE